MPRAEREGLGVRVRRTIVCFLLARHDFRRVRPRPVVAPAKATVTILRGFFGSLEGLRNWRGWTSLI